MLSKPKSLTKQFLSEEDGAFTVFAIYIVLCCIAALGVAVDYANGMRDREAMPVAAKSTALAAVIDLPSNDDAVSAGVSIARLNLLPSGNTDPIKQSDIEVGNYDMDKSVFTPDAQPYNAVNVTAVRCKSRGNQLSTYMSRLAGRSSYEITVSAMAYASSSPCSDGSFFQQTKSIMAVTTTTWKDIASMAIKA